VSISDAGGKGVGNLIEMGSTMVDNGFQVWQGTVTNLPKSDFQHELGLIIGVPNWPGGQGVDVVVQFSDLRDAGSSYYIRAPRVALPATN
jgi:hypothetical protein